MAVKAVPYFLIKGFLGLLPVSATWSGGYLTADAELLERGDELILGGLTFAANSTMIIKASLDNPVAAILTVARCFDQITAATVHLAACDEFDDPTILLEVLQGHLAQSPFTSGSPPSRLP
jgi:hypothetical protein